MAKKELMLWVGVIGAIALMSASALILPGLLIIPVTISENLGFNQIFFGLVFLIGAGLWFLIFYFIYHQTQFGEIKIEKGIPQRMGRADYIFMAGGIVAIALVGISVTIFSNALVIPTLFSSDLFTNQLVYGILFILMGIFAFFLFYFLSVHARPPE